MVSTTKTGSTQQKNKNHFTSNDPHHGIYNYILHSSGKKYIYLNTQPGRRTPKSSIIFSTVSGISSDILSGISSDILSGTLSGIYSDILSGISCGIQNILSGISYDILSGISSDILSDILSGILSGISSGILSGISSGILSGHCGPAVPTAIWKSRLRSGSAHCDLEVAVEVRQCPLRPGSRG